MTDGKMLSERVVLLSGGVQGLGAPLALGMADRGASIALMTRHRLKDAPPDLRQAVKDIRAVGAECLVVTADIRDESAVEDAVSIAEDYFGGLDACVNNASAMAHDGTEHLGLDVFDLMTSLTIRAAFVLTRACLPALRRSDNPHLLTISPPINLSSRWLAAHAPYTVGKYGMSLQALGWAAEFAADGIASNCLWPERVIRIGNVVRLFGHEPARSARSPVVMADAASAILATIENQLTGQCLLDGEVLRSHGLYDRRRHGGEESAPGPFVDL